MSRPNFTIPENPQYTPTIPKLISGDPASADETFNNWIQPVVNNTAAAMQAAQKAGARRLVDGVDYTLTTGMAKEDVDYPETAHSYGMSVNLWLSSQAGDIVGQAATWIQAWPRQRIRPQDLAGAFDLHLLNWSGTRVDMTVIDTENIYCVDETTIRSTIVTATGKHDGIALELKMAIGFDVGNQNEPGFIDQIYSRVIVTEIDADAFQLNSSHSFTQVNFTLPPISVAYEREYGALITLVDEFDAPEQLSARCRLTYVDENRGASGTTSICIPIGPNTVGQFANPALDDSFETELDLGMCLTAFENYGVHLEYKKVARNGRVLIIFPQWNWQCRVIDFELLGLWKKFEQ